MLVVYGIGLCERPILMKFDKGGISSNGKKSASIIASGIICNVYYSSIDWMCGFSWIEKCCID